MKRILFFMMISVTILAVPVSLETARNAALGHISQMNAQNIEIDRHEIITKNSSTVSATAYLFHLAPTGFVVIASDTRLNPVIGWSFDNDIIIDNNINNAGEGLIKAHIASTHGALPFTSQDVIDDAQLAWEIVLEGEPMGEMTVYGPLIDTDWGQGSPYNSFAPMDPETGSRSITGCVATAMAQVIDFYEYPPHIDLYDYDDYYSEYTEPPILVTGTPASIDTIDYNGAGIHPTNNTIAQIMKACGVSVEMSYSSSASGAWVYAYHMLTYWRFGRADDLDPEDDDFLTELASSIMNDKPCLFSMYGDYGHEVVCDGYNSSTSTFHLNMGWDGYGNGWWNFTSTMPSGFEYLSNAVGHLTPPRCDVFYVPSPGYPDIQSALMRCWVGDTIEVADGRYDGEGFRNIDTYGNRVYIRSQSGAAACTLDLRDIWPHSAFDITNGEGRELVIDGFTIIGSAGSENGAISIEQSSPTIRNCIITGGSADFEAGGHAIASTWAYPRVENTIMCNNQAFNGGGMRLIYSSPEIINCNFSNNSSVYGGGIWMSNRSNPVILNTVFDGNSAYGGGHAIYLQYDDEASVCQLTHCLVPILDIDIEEDAGEIAIGEGVIFGPVLQDDDFTPLADSYTRDSGTETLHYLDIKLPETDIWGNPRLLGTACDIGAVESNGSPENRKPIINICEDDLFIALETSISVDFFVSDPEGNPITRELIAPSGATVIGGNRIVWNSADSDVGVYDFKLIASDGEYSDTASFSVNIVNGICGAVSGTWTLAESPYHVVCDIFVDESLIIEAGVEVIFDGPFNLEVGSGALLEAIGTEDANISFTSETSWGGITMQNASDASILRYCNVTNCDANLKNTPPWGGAMHISRCAPSLEYCTFAANEAVQGGALFLEFGEITISNCLIEDNSATLGGGIYCKNSTPLFTDCSIELNSADESGGAIKSQYSFITMSNCQIIDNTAGLHAGGIYLDNGISNISETTFRGNSALANGGGLYLTNSASTIAKCLFESNIASIGGGLIVTDLGEDKIAKIQQNILQNNYAVYGGGISINSCDRTDILTNVLFNNLADYGGGMAIDESNPVIINNTITDNLTSEASGGGIFVQSASIPLIHNTIIHGNNSDGSTSFADLHASGSDVIIYTTYSNIDRSQSGGSGIISYGDGSVDADPMFTDEYHISGECECVNGGERIATSPITEETIMSPFRDIDDTFRPQDGQWDIGADETAMASVFENLPTDLTYNVYPNPFNSALCMEAPQGSQVQIFDVSGKKVFEGLSLGLITWNPQEDIPSGVYLVKIDSNSELSQKVIFVR